MTNVVRLISYSEPSDKLSSFYQDLGKSRILKKKEEEEWASNRLIFNESSRADEENDKFWYSPVFFFQGEAATAYIIQETEISCD